MLQYYYAYVMHSSGPAERNIPNTKPHGYS